MANLSNDQFSKNRSMSLAEPNTASAITLSARDFARFAQFITSELGIKMPEAKVPMLQSRLMRRLRVLNLDSIEHRPGVPLQFPQRAR